MKRYESPKKYRMEAEDMGANPKTTAFLKECLADALIQLLEEKPFEKITIPEIAESAGVGRTTYFRNFTAKEEVLTYKYIRLWERWAEEHDLQERTAFSADNGLTFFQYNYTIRNLLELTYRRGLQSALYESFHQIMKPQYGANPLECYKSRFFSYGLFGLLDEWIMRGFYESPEEMAGIVHQLLL